MSSEFHSANHSTTGGRRDLVVRPLLHPLAPADSCAIIERSLVGPTMTRLRGHLSSGVGVARGAGRDLLRLLRGGGLCVLVDMSTLYVMPAELRDALSRCRRDPQRIAELERTDPVAFRRLLDHGLLVDAGRAFEGYRPCKVEVEINAHCNYRCAFCPVRKRPRPKAFMSEATFTTILERMLAYGMHIVDFAIYNEPLLHPRCLHWLELAVAAGLHVQLFTNASLLDARKIERIAAAGNTELIVNLPSIDPEEYERVTGSKRLERVLANLDLAGRVGLPTRLSVNVPVASQHATIAAISARFGEAFGQIARWGTVDRAGALDAPDYTRPRQNVGRLRGCRILEQQISVNVEGKVMPCCMDFEQKRIWGDLTRQSFDEILRGDAATRFRRRACGLEPPPPGFMCSSCAHTSSLDESRQALGIGDEAQNQGPTAGGPVKRGVLRAAWQTLLAVEIAWV